MRDFKILKDKTRLPSFSLLMDELVRQMALKEITEANKVEAENALTN